jgi:hypothetical protein
MKTIILKIEKLVFLFLVICALQTVNAQAPQKMSYQAIIRNSSQGLIVSAAVGMKISILQGSEAGTAVYVETQTVTTNSNGLASLKIGQGNIIIGSFVAINWANGPYFIKTETDPTGGSSYSISGTTELMSVPYALFSANSTPGPAGPAGTTAPNTVDTAGIVAAPTASSHRYTWKTDKNGNPAWRKENKTTYYIENF